MPSNLHAWAQLHATNFPPPDPGELRTYKQSLCAALPQAQVEGGRSSAHIKEMRRRVQVDIDPGPNPLLLPHLREAHQALLNFAASEMVCVSASGRGLYAFIRTQDKWSRDLAEAVCDAVELHLSQFDLVCDRVNSVSPVALRFV